MWVLLQFIRKTYWINVIRHFSLIKWFKINSIIVFVHCTDVTWTETRPLIQMKALENFECNVFVQYTLKRISKCKRYTLVVLVSSFRSFECYSMNNDSRKVCKFRRRFWNIHQPLRGFTNEAEPSINNRICTLVLLELPSINFNHVALVRCEMLRGN